MKTYKGFDKDFKCRGFQYKVGESYETKETPIRCTEKGFHSCENPLNIFDYYSPATSRFAECESDGKIDKDNSDTKIASSKIKIVLELGLKEIIQNGIKFIFERVTFSKENILTGDQAGSQATGDQAGSQATGNQAGSQATGDRAMSTVNGVESTSAITGDSREGVASGLGINNKVKASIGAWIVLAEWAKDKDNNWYRKNIKSAKIDGKKMKSDTWYSLKCGKFLISK